MTTKSRKMNNYSLMRVSTVLVLTFVLVASTFSFPMGILTSATDIRNSPPYVPYNPGPANGSINVSVYLNLNWTGGDPDNDTVTYDVYFGTAIPPQLVSLNQSLTLFNPGILNYTTKYYWRVIAWDNHSNSSQGPLWEFTTKANTPPYTPSDPIPANGSTNVSAQAKLSWSGGDPDGDAVTYDVYFGNSSPPSKIISNQSATTYNPGTLGYVTLYYWMIVAWDSQNASAVGPEWHFTTEFKPNNPPNKPSNPSPTNGATDVPLDTVLTWVGGDPDNDPVKYDVFFGPTSSPPLVQENQTEVSYTPTETLTYNTIYYWKIRAWDNHSASSEGQTWHFTTKQVTGVSLNITKPKANTLYIQDSEKMGLPIDTIIYGPITITAEASAGSGIARVEFYIDGVKKATVTAPPYQYFWQPLIQFNGLSLKHNIKVIAYDNNGNNATKQLNVTKWRFHPLPWIIGGVAIATRFITHTTISGLIYNFKESRISVSFYAIRTHYRTVGPFKSARGVINFKSCMGSIPIGPMKLVRFGPFHKFAYGTFTIIGNIHYSRDILGGGIGQALLSQLLQGRGNQ
jgi:hypothetical protein